MYAFSGFFIKKNRYEYLYIDVIYQLKALEKENLMSMCRALSAHIQKYFWVMKVRIVPT